MKVLHEFPIPEEPPVVPQRLADRVISLWPHIKKVDVTIARAGGWQVVNAITVDGDEDPASVYEMVKLSGDNHASQTGASAKYRAQFWIGEVGRDGKRAYCTFPVQYDEEDPSQTAADDELQMMRSHWRELFDSQQDLIKMSARFTEFAIERVVSMSKQQGEQLNPLTDVIHELVTPYRDGLEMQARAVKEMGDMRVRQQLAEAKADDSGKFWEMFGPAVQIAASQVVTHHPPKDAPVSRAPRVEPQAQPTEAQATEPAPTQEQEDSVPNTLHGLARRLIDGMSSDTLVQVTRVLEDDQAGYFQGIARASDDDSSAEAIVALMHSLMRTPAVLVSMQQILGSDHVRAFQQVAVLAKRHLDERDAAESGEQTPKAAAGGAPPTATTPPSVATAPCDDEPRGEGGAPEAGPTPRERPPRAITAEGESQAPGEVTWQTAAAGPEDASGGTVTGVEPDPRDPET